MSTAQGTANFRGNVEFISREEVRGWVVDHSAPDRRLRLELWSNARAVASASADMPRGDLAVLELGRTDYGFILRLPPNIAIDLNHLRLKVANSDFELPLSESTAALEGVVENIVGDRLFGWAWRVGVTSHRVPLIVRRSGTELCRTVADRPRADLVRAGIGDGSHAFLVDLRQFNWVGAPGDVEVLFAETGVRLHSVSHKPADELPVAEPSPEQATEPGLQPIAQSSGKAQGEVLDALLAAMDFGEDEAQIMAWLNEVKQGDSPG